MSPITYRLRIAKQSSLIAIQYTGKDSVSSSRSDTDSQIDGNIKK